MPRCNNWPTALALFIQEKRSQPFDWATNNCAFFGCDWIAMLMGIDPAATLRTKIKTAADAARVLKRRGGIEKISEKVCSRQGWPEIATIAAQRGDIVLIETEQGPALGVCVGGRAAFAGTAGVAFEPMAKCRRAWRIG